MHHLCHQTIVITAVLHPKYSQSFTGKLTGQRTKHKSGHSQHTGVDNLHKFLRYYFDSPTHHQSIRQPLRPKIPPLLGNPPPPSSQPRKRNGYNNIPTRPHPRTSDHLKVEQIGDWLPREDSWRGAGGGGGVRGRSSG